MTKSFVLKEIKLEKAREKMEAFIPAVYGEYIAKPNKVNIVEDENIQAYTYDLYDMVDISLMEEGDTIIIQNQEVEVATLKRTEHGLVIINGGEENGGYDLYTDDSGVYYEMGFSDVKAYYPLGEATIRVSVDFKFYDNSDLEAGEKMFYPGDFLIDDAGIRYDFNANNTTIVIEDGQIIAMNRIYTP